MRNTYFYSLLIVGLFAASHLHAEQYRIQVSGMVCAWCSQGVAKKLDKVEGIKKGSVQVSLEDKSVLFETEAGKNVDLKHVRKMVEKASIKVVDIKPVEKSDPQSKQLKESVEPAASSQTEK